MSEIEWPEKKRPGFVVFHHDCREDGYGLGQPEDKSYFDFKQIEEYMRGILVHPENFLGLIDQFDETLQFLVNEDRSILIDFIVKEKQGSLQKQASLNEAIALALSAGPSLAQLTIPAASFKAW
jgi:hypothetical protein